VLKGKTNMADPICSRKRKVVAPRESPLPAAEAQILKGRKVGDSLAGATKREKRPKKLAEVR